MSMFEVVAVTFFFLQPARSFSRLSSSAGSSRNDYLLDLKNSLETVKSARCFVRATRSNAVVGIQRTRTFSSRSKCLRISKRSRVILFSLGVLVGRLQRSKRDLQSVARPRAMSLPGRFPSRSAS